MKTNGKSSANKGFIGKLYSQMGNYFQKFDSKCTKSFIKISSEKVSSEKVSKIADNLQYVSFSNGDYNKYSDLECYVIYCNPPTCYYSENGSILEVINMNNFWNWCRKMSNKNLIIISEYSAPDDFGEILSTRLQKTRKGLTETLFLM